MSTRILARLATVAIGIWLEFAPAVLSYDTPAADVDRLLGPVAASLAFVSMWAVVHMLRWSTIPVGILLVVAPVLGYPVVAAVSSILSGLAIVGLAFVGGEPEGAFGGGWRVIWEGRRQSA